MTRSNELRVARPRRADWPKELSHLRAGLRVRSVLFYAGALMLVAFAWVVFLEVWSFLLGGHIESVFERWWGVSVADLVTDGIRAGLFAFVLIETATWCKRARTGHYLDVLLSHGFCPCGYKYVEQGDSRSCLECGRQWTAKQPPRE